MNIYRVNKISTGVTHFYMLLTFLTILFPAVSFASQDRMDRGFFGNNCSDVTEIFTGDCICGTTTDNTNDFDCSPGNSWFDAKDEVYMFSVPDRYRVHLTGEATFDADYAVSTVCDGSGGDILCVDNVGVHVDPSCSALSGFSPWGDLNFVFDVGTGEGGVFYLWVDGKGVNAQGDYCIELDIYPIPTGEDCEDPYELQSGDCYCGDITSQYIRNNYDCAGDGTFDSKDAVFHFTVPDRYRVHVIGESTNDGDWAISTVCDDGTADTVLCTDNTGAQLQTSCSTLSGSNYYGRLDYTFDVGVAEGGDYYLWADAKSGHYSGDFCVELLMEPIPAGEDCLDPYEMESGDCVCGNITSQYIRNNHDCSEDGTFNSKDAVFHFTASDRQRVKLVGEANFDADWAVSTVCDDGSAETVLCVDNIGEQLATSCSNISAGWWGRLDYIFDVGVGEGGDFYVWADAKSGHTSGDFCLEIFIDSIPVGEDCLNPFDIEHGDCICADNRTTYLRNDFDCSSGTGQFDSPDGVYRFYAPRRHRILITGEATSDLDWSISSVCDESTGDILCADNAGSHVDPPCSALGGVSPWGDINFSFDTGSDDAGYYYLWVDGKSGQVGDYCFDLSIVSIDGGEDCIDPYQIAAGDCVCGSTADEFIRNDFDCSPEELHFNSTDAVYQFTADQYGILRVAGEANYDADWAISSVCDGSTGDILCTGNTGANPDLVCSTISSPTTPWGDLNYQFEVYPGNYYIWVDGNSTQTGDYCLEADFTPLATPTPTATPTATPEPGMLEGIVAFERTTSPPNPNWAMNIDLTLCNNGNPTVTYNTITDENGEFSVEVWSGNYDILLKQDHSLANRADNVTIPLGGTSEQVDFGVLSEGDANNDNTVTSSDFFILRDSYNTSSGEPGFDARADFNEDGSITSADFFLLRSHYNQGGEDCSGK